MLGVSRPARAVLLLLLVAIGWQPAPARAARMWLDHVNDTRVIIVQGELKPTDGEAFAKLAEPLDKALVIMHSPGGSVLAGLSIGRLIRLKGFATGVPDEAFCASACALAWLGGAPRLLGPRAALGFHAAYRMEAGRPVESGVGNALIGAYLAQLGLSEKAIIYISTPPPRAIQWLHPGDAKAVGIEFVLTARGKTPPERPVAEPSPEPDRGPQEIAARFADVFFAHWSESNEAALRFYAGAYLPRVNYRGTAIPREQIMEEKRLYVERWPTRVYLVRPNSVRVACNGSGSACTIEGDVAWDCRSAARQAHTTGMAKFTIELDIAPSGEVQVAGEWGEVIARTVTP